MKLKSNSVAGTILRHRAEVELRSLAAQRKVRPLMAALAHKVTTQLRKRRKPSASARSHADPQRMLHELEVHQLELEMQNTELQESRNQMEVQLDKYTDLYDFAPVGYFSLDKSGAILEANLTGAAMLGVERSLLIQRRLQLFVAPAKRAKFTTFLESVFTKSGKQICEISLLNRDGLVFWADLQAVSAISPDAARKWCRVAVSDISVLKQAEEVLHRNESLFTALIAQAPDGVFVVDQHLCLQQVNPKALPVFKQVHPLLNRHISDIMHILWPKPVAAEIVRQFKHTLRTGNAFKSTAFSETRRDSGVPEAYDWQIQRITLPAGQHGVVCFFNDITERVRAEEAIARLAAIVKSSEDAIISKDLGGLITTWNRGAERLFGYLAEEAIGQPISLIFARQHLMAGLSKRVHHGEAIESFETVCRHKEGRSVDVSLAISPITDAQGRIVGVSKIMRDITERKRAQAAQRRAEVLAASNQKLKQEIVRRQVVETALKASENEQRVMLADSHLMQEQLRQLARQVLKAQEEERKEISRELHDVIAQTLTGINIRLAALKKEAAVNTTSLDQNIARTQKLVAHSVDIVHRFARELRPAVLDDLGLIPALHTYLKYFTERTGVRTALTAFAGVEQMDITERTVLFRVAQEALANVSRHAHASRVEVTFTKLPHGIAMKIADNGNSFSVEQTLLANHGKRLGLLGMRERLQMVGGQFKVVSTPGQGTTIEAQLPLRKIVAKERGVHAASTSPIKRASKRAEARAP